MTNQDLMDSYHRTTEQFDDYLGKIQARERIRQRNIFILGILMIGILGIGLVMYQWPDLLRRDAKLRTFKFEELSEEKVGKLFHSDPHEILVSHPVLRWDTIHNVAEFTKLQELSELISTARVPLEAEHSPSHSTDSVFSTDQSSLGAYVLDIEGDRRVDQELVFSIENYEPNVEYTLDFGNGVKRRIRARTHYTYPLQGNYTVQLIATSEERGSSIYSKRFKISPLQVANGSLASSANISSATSPNARVVPELNLPLFNEPTALTTPRSSEEIEIKDSKTDLKIQDLGESLAEISPASTKPDPKIEPTSIPNARFSDESSIRRPLVYADEMPEFPGGTSELQQFIRRNVHYPPLAQERRIEGRVVVQFVVNTDGTLSDSKVLKGIGGGCDAEALKVVKRMPPWQPGKVNGEKVPVYRTIPIVFKIL